VFKPDLQKRIYVQEIYIILWKASFRSNWSGGGFLWVSN